MTNPIEVLAKAACKRFVSRLDLTKAFLQVGLDESSQELTAFSCFLGTLCWTRCSQGLSNAPRTMHRLMDNLLRGTSAYTSCLLDDIIIFPDSYDLHEIHIREILSRLRAANLTASLSKSEFLLKEITILGHTLHDGFISPSDKHIADVITIGPQLTKHGVRALAF